MACCDGPSVNVEGSFAVGLCAKALRFLEMHTDHNYLYYGDPGGAATAKCGGRPLRGRLRSMACCDGPSVNIEGSFAVGLCAKALLLFCFVQLCGAVVSFCFVPSCRFVSSFRAMLVFAAGAAV